MWVTMYKRGRLTKYTIQQAYELSTLTGTQVLLLVVSETGLVYTFTTPKLQPLVTKPEGKNLIQSCLNTPDNSNMIENNNNTVMASSSSSPSMVSFRIFSFFVMCYVCVLNCASSDYGKNPKKEKGERTYTHTFFFQ